MANRINYNIRIRLKYTKTFNKKIKILLGIIKEAIKWKSVRQLLIKDNIITPFNRLVTCRIKDHTFIDSDEDYFWCTRCGKHLSTKDYEQYTRSRKIKKLIKKTKK